MVRCRLVRGVRQAGEARRGDELERPQQRFLAA
jgi:hypothetical protein